MRVVEELLQADLDVLGDGGQQAVALFLTTSVRLHESHQPEALQNWMTLATAALPEKDRRDVMTVLMYGFLYMNYQSRPLQHPDDDRVLH